MSKSSEYSYVEQREALAVRVEANRRFATFSLEEWLDRECAIRRGQFVLDVGCGNGNFTQFFWDRVQPSGAVLGLDKNKELLEDARARHLALPQKRVGFVECDVEACLEIPIGFQNDVGGDFDWVIALYSVYYIRDIKKFLSRVRGVLAPGGRLVLVGPGPENAMEMIHLHERATGEKVPDAYLRRQSRLWTEIRVEVEHCFGNVATATLKDSIVGFPDAAAYLDYYRSTLLWREGPGSRSLAERQKVEARALALLRRGEIDLKLKKQVACIIA